MRIVLLLLFFLFTTMAHCEVVNIELYNGPITSHGTGTVIGNGYILTNKHVVEDNKIAYVIESDTVKVPFRVVYKDKDYDIALLRGDTTRYKPFSIGTPSKGIARAEGWFDGQYHYSEGWYEVKGDIIEYQGNVYNGQSGGALVDRDGRLIGLIVNLVYDGNTCYFLNAEMLPIQLVMDRVKSHMK